MLTKTQVDQFQWNGYVLGNHVIDADQVAVLRAELDRVIESRDRGGRQPVSISNLSRNPDYMVWQVVNIWEASEAFKNLVCNRQIAEEVAQLTGASELRVWHDQIQYKPAGVGGVNMWHQDWPYWGILNGPTQVTAWVALDDVDEANGCMSMVAGSHQWGNQIEFLHQIKAFDAMPASFMGQALVAKACPVPAGTVHYHHALTWHGSPANRSQRPRRALAIHLMTGETRYVAAGKHLMRPFVDVSDGEVIRGSHFPQVWP